MTPTRSHTLLLHASAEYFPDWVAVVEMTPKWAARMLSLRLAWQVADNVSERLYDIRLWEGPDRVIYEMFLSDSDPRLEGAFDDNRICDLPADVTIPDMENVPRGRAFLLHIDGKDDGGVSFSWHEKNSGEAFHTAEIGWDTIHKVMAGTYEPYYPWEEDNGTPSE